MCDCSEIQDKRTIFPLATSIISAEGVCINFHKVWRIGVCQSDGCFESELEADTLEKLWLMYVMKELYNKTWDGEWVNV